MENPPLIDITTLMESFKEGTMIHHWLLPESGKPETAFLIRENEDFVNTLGDEIEFEWGYQSFELNGVIVVIVMLRVGSRLYDDSFSYYANRLGKPTFEELENRDEFPVGFSVPQLAQVYNAHNRLKPLFQEMLRLAPEFPRWTKEQFLEAQQVVLSTYPTDHALWHAMVKPDGIEPDNEEGEDL